MSGWLATFSVFGASWRIFLFWWSWSSSVVCCVSSRDWWTSFPSQAPCIAKIINGIFECDFFLLVFRFCTCDVFRMQSWIFCRVKRVYLMVWLLRLILCFFFLSFWHLSFCLDFNFVFRGKYEINWMKIMETVKVWGKFVIFDETW